MLARGSTTIHKTGEDGSHALRRRRRRRFRNGAALPTARHLCAYLARYVGSPASNHAADYPRNFYALQKGWITQFAARCRKDAVLIGCATSFCPTLPNFARPYVPKKISTDLYFFFFSFVLARDGRAKSQRGGVAHFRRAVETQAPRDITSALTRSGGGSKADTHLLPLFLLRFELHWNVYFFRLPSTPAFPPRLYYPPSLGLGSPLPVPHFRAFWPHYPPP